MSLTEEGVGQLMTHFTLKNIVAEYMADINPFDQPAVEQSQVADEKKP